jgi:hypothetical protein
VAAGATIARGDFDGDGLADVGFYSPSDGFWYLVVNAGRSALYIANWQS